jgi:hypothetical protein
MSSQVVTAFVAALIAAGGPAILYFVIIELPEAVRSFFSRR